MSEFKLLPCPFCGAALTRDPNGTAHHRHPDTPCFFMPFAILAGNPKEVDAWNRRSPDPAIVEALRTYDDRLKTLIDMGKADGDDRTDPRILHDMRIEALLTFRDKVAKIVEGGGQ